MVSGLGWSLQVACKRMRIWAKVVPLFWVGQITVARRARTVCPVMLAANSLCHESCQGRKDKHVHECPCAGSASGMKVRLL